MNPMMREIVMALVRWALTGISSYLVSKGVLTPDQMEYIVVGVTGLLISVGWIIYIKFRDRRKMVTALAMPSGTTENALESRIKHGETPPVTLQKNQSPY